MKVLLMLAFFVTAQAGQIKGDENVQEYLYDFNVSGGVTGTINLAAVAGHPKLPQGAVVEAVHYRVLKSLTSSAASSISFGNMSSVTAYTSAISHSTLASPTVGAGSQGASYLVDTDDKSKLVLRLTGSNLTAGKILLWINYYYPTKN